MSEEAVPRILTEEDRIRGFQRATCGMAGASKRWEERAAKGMTDAELADALAFEIGIMGGSGGPDALSLWFQGAGLKIWISCETQNTHKAKPTFAGKSTIAMARMVYGVKDPADVQLMLL